MGEILREIEQFCQGEVSLFLESSRVTPRHPYELLKSMANFGLFGFNIPEQFGGSKIPVEFNLPINRILSRYTLILPALYGIHLRACQYFMQLATDEQKKDYLPLLARGEAVITHAFHEKSIRNPLKFATVLNKQSGGYVLSGRKEWVINVRHCDFMVVIARMESSSTDGGPQCCAVMVNKNMPGVFVDEEYHRRGMHGLSLSRVIFNDVKISEFDIVGGADVCAQKVATSFQPMPLLSFSARCVGVAESIVDRVRPHLALGADELSKGVIYYKWSELQMIKDSIVHYFESSVRQNKEKKLSLPQAYRTKVFCSQSLNVLVEKASMLCGGRAYASDDFRLLQQFDDAGSLAYTDSPNDILLSVSGGYDLNDA